MPVAELTDRAPRRRSEAKAAKRGRRPGRLGNALVHLLTAVGSLPGDSRFELVELIRVIAADTRQARAAVAAMKRAEAAAVRLRDEPPREPLTSRPNPRPLVGAALAAVPNGNGRQLAEYIARRFGATIAPNVVSAEAAILRRRGWNGRFNLSARRLGELVRLVETLGGSQLGQLVALAGICRRETG